MAYWLGVYGPTGAGITRMYVYNANTGSLIKSAAPLGTSTQCISISGINYPINIAADLENGVSVARWVINVDGTTYSQYLNTCSIGWDSSVTSVSTINVRLEVSGTPITPTETYYARLAFNANSGSGAPSTLYGSTEDGEYVKFAIPSTVPTRSGYIFDGWQLEGSGSYYTYGDYISVWGTTSSPGQLHTMYAHWTKKEETNYVWVYYNGWRKAIPWVYSNGWSKAKPWIYSNGWKTTS